MPVPGACLSPRVRVMSKALFRISAMGNVTSQDMDRLLRCFAQLRR